MENWKPLLLIFEKGAFTKSADPDETPHNVASHHVPRYLPCSAMNNIKSYMNQAGPLSLR